MNQKEPADFVVEAFGRGKSREEIIQKVREKYDMNPREAEMFVLRVETDRDQDISIRQGPVLFGISLFACMLGLVLVLSSIWTIATSIFSAPSGPSFVFDDVTSQAGMFLLLGISFAFSGWRWLRYSPILAKILHRKF
jgi:hypothetical protein